MKILQPSPTQLIAHNSPFGSQLGSSLLLILGVSMFAIPNPSEGEYLSTQFCAGVVVCFSVIKLLTSGRFITWKFDKSDNSLLVQSQILFITKTLRYTLAEIETVQIESKTLEDGETFGVELLLAGKDRLHLCPNFNLSEFTAKEGVRRISTFITL
jgi:hypothetical protein